MSRNEISSVTPVASTHVASTDVEKTVIDAIAQALDLAPEEVSLGASLEEEYGAESLDLLDIVFYLEQAHHIRLPRMDLMQHAEEHFGREKLVEGGRLTAFAIDLLRHLRPEVEPGFFRQGLQVSDARRLMTPQSFVRLVLRLLDAKNEALETRRKQGCEQCGQHNIQASNSSPVFVCEDCGADELVPSGDEVFIRDLQAFSARHDG